MGWEQTERRQPGPSRIPAQIRVEFLEKPAMEALSVNVSLNGLLVLAPHDRDVDSFVRMQVFIPPKQESFEVMARVASRVYSSNMEALGIHFIGIGPEDKIRWREFLEHIQELAGVSPIPERRDTERLHTAYMVRFKSTGRLEEFVTKNISAGGMFVATPMKKEVGEKFKLVLVHPETDQVFELFGEVTRLEGHDNPNELVGFALKFLELDEAKQNKLFQFIASSQDSSGQGVVDQ